MNKAAIFNFDVEKGGRSISVERSFNAPLDTVWAAWTDKDILCRWWAPKPYTCVIKSQDLRDGGRLLYYMKGPEGDIHWSFFDYASVKPKSFYSGSDGFCDEQGRINTDMPRSTWENRFSEEDGRTVVRIKITHDSAEDVEKIIAMGFKEGFSMGLDQLEQLLADRA